MKIRALRPGDERSAFHSGDESLNRVFRSYAGQNQFRHHLGVTYVAVEDHCVLAFATVAPGQLDIEDLPIATRKKLPRYPLPILRLARLAVDQSAQSQGLGTQLLGFVFRLAVKMAEEYGCAGVVVDAKPEAVRLYGKVGVVPFDALEGQSDARPRPTMMFLAMNAIKAVSTLRSG